MEWHILQILTTVSVVVVGVSHAALPSEVYWKNMLPYTAMPKAVIDSLYPGRLEGKSTTVTVNHESDGAATHKAGSGTIVSIQAPKSIGASTGNPRRHDIRVNVRKGGVPDTDTREGKHIHVGAKFDFNVPGVYIYSTPAMTLYFLQKDLTAGTKMTLQFTIGTRNDAIFLSCEAADSIPFSSEKLQAVLSRFSINPESDKAAAMKKTLKECETDGIKGEDKFCATSLESMVDYVTSKLGNKVEAVSIDAGKEASNIDKYTFTEFKRIDVGGKVVACHKERYAYAVFYCHTPASLKAYTVELAGEGGGKVRAPAVCHEDTTTAWDPKILASQGLKVKPGSGPVCHFLPEDHIVWVRSS